MTMQEGEKFVKEILFMNNWVTRTIEVATTEADVLQQLHQLYSHRGGNIAQTHQIRVQLKNRILIISHT